MGCFWTFRSIYHFYGKSRPPFLVQPILALLFVFVIVLREHLWVFVANISLPRLAESAQDSVFTDHESVVTCCKSAEILT